MNNKNNKMKKLFLPLKIMLKTDKLKFFLLCLIAFLIAFANYIVLFSMNKIMNLKIDTIFSENLIVAVMPILAYAVMIFSSFVSLQIIESFEYKVGLYISKKILAKSLSFKGIAMFESPDYVQKTYTLQNAKSVMAGSVNSFFMLFLSLANLCFLLYFFANISPLFLLVLIPAVIPIYFIEKNKAKLLMQKQMNMQMLRQRVYQYKFMALSQQHAQDNRIFSFIPLLKKYSEQMNAQVRQTWKKFKNKQLLIDVLSFLVKMLVTAGVLALSFFYFSKSQISFGSSVVLIFAVYRIFKTAAFVSTQVGASKQVFLFFDVLSNYLQEKDNLALEQSKKELNEKITSLEFKNVSFSYPQNPEKQVLQDLSFKIDAGESIALVGANGAGKSTLVKLLMRFYEPDSGEILVNGSNIKEFTVESYRKAISAVFQDFSKFSLSLSENIFVASDPTQRASIDDLLNNILNKMDERYNTMIGQDLGGRELSGGEWQKVAIARGLSKQNTSLFLADEPVSAIDPIEESNIYRFLLSAKDASNITIITTHRMACAKVVTKIMLLENGKLIEFDSHERLLEKSQKYSEIYKSQADSYI